jgi:hypothetical protein
VLLFTTLLDLEGILIFVNFFLNLTFLNFFRTIIGETGVNGHILAPDNILDQRTGVIEGKIVVADVRFSTQINQPNCFPIQNITFSGDVDAPSSAGDNVLHFDNNPGFALGDTLDIPSNPPNTLEAVIASENGVDLQLSSPLSADVPEQTRVSATVSSDSNRPVPEVESASSASVMAASALLVFIVLML